MSFEIHFVNLCRTGRTDDLFRNRRSVEKKLKELGIKAIIGSVDIITQNDFNIIFKSMEDMNLFKLSTDLKPFGIDRTLKKDHVVKFHNCYIIRQ